MEKNTFKFYLSRFLNKNTAHRLYTLYASMRPNISVMSLLYHAGMKQSDYITDLRLDKMYDYNSDKVMTIG